LGKGIPKFEEEKNIVDNDQKLRKNDPPPLESPPPEIDLEGGSVSQPSPTLPQETQTLEELSDSDFEKNLGNPSPSVPQVPQVCDSSAVACVTVQDNQPSDMAFAQVEKPGDKTRGQQSQAIEAEIAKIVPRGSKHDKFISAKSDEHYTPKYFLEAVVECMGGIDLDPASNSHDNPNVLAARHLTIEDDALKHNWAGRVFLNPPFSEVSKFLKKLISEIESGRVVEAIVLTKSDTRTKWYKQLRLNAQALCFAEGYHKFGTAENSATFGVLLSYFGNNPDRFGEVFRQFGVIGR
jgi:phage N-6-adenine-methyltransferase